MEKFLDFTDKYVTPLVVLITISAILCGIVRITGMPRDLILIFLAISTAWSLMFRLMAEQLFFPLLFLTITFFLMSELIIRFL